MKTIIRIISLMAVSTTAIAEPSGGVDISANFGVLFDLAAFVSGVIGLFLVAAGVYNLYTWSKTGGQGKTIGGSVLTMLIGTLLASIGWFYELVKGSIIGRNNAGVSMESNGQFNLALDQAALKASEAIHSSGFGKFIPEGTLTAILAFVFLVGFIAFISGVYSLKDVTDSRGQHPVMSPVIKIIGGVICMNITWFSCLMASLLNLPALCSGG